jgi:hypothetical protein
MSNKFDELAKGLAQSVTRREAFRRFGLGLFGALAASVGLGRASGAQPLRGKCAVMPNFAGGNPSVVYTGVCVDPNTCQRGFSSNCPAGGKAQGGVSACGTGTFLGNKNCSF